MSKKKRKTRSEKEVVKSHNFGLPVYKATKSNGAEKEVIKERKNLLDPRIISDLRKTGETIGIVLLLISVLTFVLYKTSLLVNLLTRLNIKY